jgi:pimeloyl-ACP methyl ester carboxylesterase
MSTLEELGITSRVVKANGHRVHLLEAGSGPLVLFVHGFPEIAYSWRYQLPAVAQAGYRAVAPDQLGYGRSSKPPLLESYRITELVRTLIGTVEALGEETAVIVGHDWGAPVAWAAAWMHPEIFTSVVTLGVPFGDRGQMGFPGSVHGEVKPSEIERRIAGPDLVLYQEYFKQPGIPELEMEEDVRTWLTNLYFSFSADAGLPPAAPADDAAPLEERLANLRNSGLCLEPGARFGDKCIAPEVLPEWLPQEDLDVYVAEFERTGFTGALNNYYRSLDLNWEVLAPWSGTPVTVPALFVTADRDAPMLWAGEAIARMETAVPQLRDTIIYDNCGHWVQQERKEDFNRDLLAFLADVKPVG